MLTERLLMDNYIAFVNSYSQMLGEHLGQLNDFLNDANVKELCWEYNDSGDSQQESRLNIFEIISERYYRENFHSDILKVFLDPEGSHNEGSVFLFAFIDFLNKEFSDKVCILKQNYTSAIVDREYGNIDILIRSENTKHCIIIENKIYNAVDMDRQLPRYYDYMTELGYIIDAIVYLPLDIYKKPDQSTWDCSKLDMQHVLPLLCIVPAYQKKGENLVTGWIHPCILKAKQLDCVSILRQYGELLIRLNHNNMDNVILSKFYQSLKDEKNYENAISIKNMILELPIYMADRLCERFKVGEGDYAVWKYKPNFCGIAFKFPPLYYKIDIYTSEEGYKVYVFCQNDKTGGRELEWAEGMESLQSFTLTNDDYRKTDFSFYDEEDLIQSVNSVINEMRERLIKK